MTPGDVNQRIAKLSNRQREVLRLVCEGDDYKTIGRRLYITEGAVKAHMGNVYIKLQMAELSRTERVKTLHAVYCPALRAAELPPGAVESEEPEPVPGAVQDMVEDDEQALIVYQKPELARPVEVIPVQPPPPTNGEVKDGCWRRLRPIVVGLLLGLVLAAGLFLVFRDAILGGQPPIVQVTAPAEPDNGATDTQPTSPPTAPSDTPEPTATPKPSLLLPFEDAFDQGLRPEWRVTNGQMVFINGHLKQVGNDYLTLQIGDSSLGGNYTVSLDTATCGYPLEVTVGERVRFNFAAGNIFVWEAFQDNQWVTLASPSAPPCEGNLQIRVAGNAYTVVAQGSVVLEGTYGEAVYGTLTIAMRNGREIDNFSITSP